MTDRASSGHESAPARASAAPPDATATRPSFHDVYGAHAAFLFRAARAMGVPVAALDDVLQDVFVVVHRRLSEHDGRAVRAWLLQILFNVVREHRRRFVRKRDVSQRSDVDADAVAHEGIGADERASLQQARDLVLRILDTMDATQREVFVLVELEGLAVPEVAEAMGAGVNTTYSRLRLARKHFTEAATRARRAMDDEA